MEAEVDLALCFGGVGIAPEREAQVGIIRDEQAALTGIVDGCERGRAARLADERDRAEVKDALPVDDIERHVVGRQLEAFARGEQVPCRRMRFDATLWALKSPEAALVFA